MHICVYVIVCVCMCVRACACVHACNKETQSLHTGNRHTYSYVYTLFVAKYVCNIPLLVHLLLHVRKINTFPRAKETPAPYLFLLPPLPSSVYVRMYRCGHGCFVGIGTPRC